ncbi:mucin-2, partial [Trichomycterus rosablanca]|uniref:mucin-2 n=1 Tax=Trichomycterus rosablanca TaxID=2290929 RepID=UPI002F360B0E
HSTGTLPLLGSPRYCPGANSASGYLCQTGHCCGETGCCTYYYELWWFWLLWSVLILFSCCCAYRHRQAKQRVQQQQRQREINLMAYHGACSYPSSMLDLSFLASLKLPSYEEVAAQPSTPPPPYSSVAYPRGTAHPGPSHMLSSQSSDNYTSCSCDSCCPSSPCSSSPSSAQLTDETDTSHTSTPSHSEVVNLNSIPEHSTERHDATVLSSPQNAPVSTSSAEVELSDCASLDCNGNRTVKPVTNQTINNNMINEPEEITGTANATQHANTSDIINAGHNPAINDASNGTQTNNANDVSSHQTPTLSPTRDDMSGNTALGFFQQPSNMTQNISASRPPVSVPSSPPSCSPISPSTPSLPPPLSPLTDPLGALSGAAQTQNAPPPPQSPLKAAFSSGVDVLEPDRRDSAVCDLDVDQTHFQQRRLTGDSGIEVCRCRINQEDEEDEEDEERDRMEAEMSTRPNHELHDSVDCSSRAQPGESWPEMCGSTQPTQSQADSVFIAMESI